MSQSLNSIDYTLSKLEEYCFNGILEDIDYLRSISGKDVQLENIQDKVVELFKAGDWDGLLKTANEISIHRVKLKEKRLTPEKFKYHQIILGDEFLACEFRLVLLRHIAEQITQNEKLCLWKKLSETAAKRLDYLLLYGEQLLFKGDAKTIEVLKRALMIKSNSQSIQKALHNAYTLLNKSRKIDIENDPFGKTITKNLNDRFCFFPFWNLEIHRNSTHCCCPAWMPTSLGDPSKIDILDAWNSEKAQMLRSSILDGSYRFCVKGDCPYISGDTMQKLHEVDHPQARKIIDEKIVNNLDGPKSLTLAYDPTCNLTCPSCRSEKIVVSGEENKELEKITSKIISILPGVNVITISGNGDPFFSRHYRRILSSLSRDKYPNLKVLLYTNALLFSEKNWNQYPNLHNMVKAIHVSIDAASEETYNVVRQGGNWTLLLENLKFIAKLREKGIVDNIYFKYVVQEINFREMPQFVELSKSMNALSWFIRMASPAHISGDEFEKNAIFHKEHPRHEEFLETLRHPVFREPEVEMGNLSDVFEKATV